jgi:PD-(D/E)XK nuclease superfamily
MTQQIMIRTSEISSLKRCPQRWWWGHVDGLEPNKPNNKLWFGGGIHVALADWYKQGFERGTDPRKGWLQFVRDEEMYLRDNKGQRDDDEWVSARDLGFAMLDNYLETYGKDPGWDVINTEQQFQAKITMPSAPGGFVIILGTFDGVHRDADNDNALMLMEHKTSSGGPNYGYLELADQPGVYFSVAENVLRHKGLIGENEHLDGIMYNYLRKANPDDRPRDEFGRALNKDGSVSKRQDTQRLWRFPVWRSREQRAKMRENIIATVELMMKYRTGELRVTKTPTMDCSWDCAFYAMCQLHETDADWQEYRDAMFHKRDPYQDHRLAIKSAGDDIV